MKTSQSIAELSAALAKAQAQIKNPEKNRTAKIPTKTGGSYQYHYADLPSTYDTVRKALADNNLSHTAGTLIENEQTLLSMRLLHSSGEWLESSLVLPAAHDPKTLAANLTYFRRYLFSALVGVAGDDDVDGEPESEAASYPARKPEFKTARQEQAERVKAATAAAVKVVQEQVAKKQEAEKTIDCSLFIPKAGKLAGRPLGDFEGETLKKYLADLHTALANKQAHFNDLPEQSKTIALMVEQEIAKREKESAQ